MSLGSGLLEEWEGIVDAVAAMDGGEALPRGYEATDFLPSHRHLPEELIQALQAADADLESRSKDLFQLRTTESESYRPMPLAPTFASAKNSERRLAGKAAEEEDDEEEDATALLRSSSRRKVPRTEKAQDAKDFYSRYLAMTAAGDSGKDGGGGRRASGHLSSSSSAPSVGAVGAASKLLLSRTTHLTSGFLDPTSYSNTHRQPDFMPIILVPATVTSPLQLINIHTFLTEGMYVDPPTLFVDAQTGSTNVQDTKPDFVVVNPGSFINADSHHVAFREFRVLDDPSKVDNWSHVCACIVNGKRWEFADWLPSESDPQATEPAKLFRRMCGFLPYFEEDKVPTAVQEWHVHPLLLTRRATKTQQHIKAVFEFWEALYAFLDQHPTFKVYDVRVPE